MHLVVQPADLLKYADLLDFTSSRLCTRDFYYAMNDCLYCPFDSMGDGLIGKCMLTLKHNPSITVTLRILREQHPEHFI